MRRLRVAAAGAALASAAVAVLPDAASAHGLVGKQDLPIPRWKSSQAQTRLAGLGRKAREDAAAFAAKGKLPSSLARRRAAIRNELNDVMAEIDAAVMELLGIEQEA